MHKQTGIVKTRKKTRMNFKFKFFGQINAKNVKSEKGRIF